MDRQDMRLECLKLAREIITPIGISGNPEEIIRVAGLLHDFVADDGHVRAGHLPRDAHRPKPQPLWES